MSLLPIDNKLFSLVISWLEKEENYKWLDFGFGSQPIPPAAFLMMLKKPQHCLRVFTAEVDATPIGVVAFSNIHPQFRTAMLWYLLGNKSYEAKGETTRAVGQLLKLGFRELGLSAVHAWVAEGNAASVRILERNSFRLIGRQRHCLYIDGKPRDRLLFDLLASEFPGIKENRIPGVASGAASLVGGVLSEVAHAGVPADLTTVFQVVIEVL